MWYFDQRVVECTVHKTSAYLEMSYKCRRQEAIFPAHVVDFVHTARPINVSFSADVQIEKIQCIVIDGNEFELPVAHLYWVPASTAGAELSGSLWVAEAHPPRACLAVACVGGRVGWLWRQQINACQGL